MLKKVILFLSIFASVGPGIKKADCFPAADSLIITQIVVVGNEKTKDHVILREMKTKTGERFDEEKAETDRKRIQNLRLFTRVEMEPMFTSDGVILLIYVAERWFIFPYPILYYNERDWKKLSYGAGLIYQNLKGLNQDVAGAFWLGYNPGIHFYFSNPWFGGDKRLYTHVKVFAEKIRSKSLAYDRFDENYRGATFSLGKRWGYHTFLSMQLGYRYLSVPDEYSGITASGSGTDHLPSVGLAFRYDSRDLYEYPKNGWKIDIYAMKTKYRSTIDYFRYGTDLRRYQPIFKSLSLAMRTSIDLLHGSSPEYSNLYIGYLERVRGHFFTKDEGDNRAMASVELRFPILKIRYIDLPASSMAIGSYSTNLPFGISAGLFCDTGAVWNNDDVLSDKDFLVGYGAGLHLHVPYVDVIRLEYALDSRGHSQYIFDFYVWF